MVHPGRPAAEQQQAQAAQQPQEPVNPYFKPNAALQAANNVQGQVVKRQGEELAQMDRRQQQDNVLQAEAIMSDEARQQEEAMMMAQQEALAGSTGLGPMNPTDGLTEGLGEVPVDPQAAMGQSQQAQQQGPTPEQLAQALTEGQVSVEQLGEFDPMVVEQAKQILQSIPA